MGWSVGFLNGRWVGYGVPAICDHPGCGKGIDRGLGHACGGGITGDDNCGLFFCGDHLEWNGEGDEMCTRCIHGDPPFDPTLDVREWVDHLLTDDSWQQWRDENPERVAVMSVGP